MQTAALTKIRRERLDPGALIQVRRPGAVFQINLPAFLNDGDGVSIYLKPARRGALELTDLGMTMMRMSYGREVTESIARELAAVAAANGFVLDDATGAISQTMARGDLLAGVLGLVQIQNTAQALPPAAARREC